MSEPLFRNRLSLRQDWIRYRSRTLADRDAWLRAGVADAYLPDVRLCVPHRPQSHVSRVVPSCAAMVLDYHGRSKDLDWLAYLLRTDDLHGTPGRRLSWLRPWGYHIEFPQRLQFYRDGTTALNERFADGALRLVYEWERPWLRYIAGALREGVPPILFVDHGRLNPEWGGLLLPHAVVLTGAQGRQVWVNDPARATGSTPVSIWTLMDALLPSEPLAALVRPDGPQPEPDPSDASR